MARLKIGGRPFDAGLVAFDKDGTLIDFELMWGRLAVAWVERLAAETGNEGLQRELYRSLGYDRRQQRTKPHSPLAIRTTGQLQTIAAAALYRHGIPWPEAEDLAQSAFYQTIADHPLAGLIRATGDVAGLLERLQEAGVRVAVITTDDRSATRDTLALLGVENQVDFLACGDDPIPAKPAPDAVLEACAHVGVVPARTAVVGDTVADMVMAKRAGVGCRVAVLTGAGSRDSLAAHADVVLESIAEIQLPTDPEGFQNL